MKQPLVGVIMGSVSDKETMARGARPFWMSWRSPTRPASSPPTARRIGCLSTRRPPRRARARGDHRGRRGGRSPARHGRIQDRAPCHRGAGSSSALSGLDSLLSIVQMPTGVPVATMAIGEAGAANAALMAARILGVKYPEIRDRLHLRAETIARQVLEQNQ